MEKEMPEQDNKITLVDEQGNEKDFTILFTFESEDGKNYVFFYDDQGDEEGEVEVEVMSYDQDQNLFPVVDESELNMLDEVFNSLMSEEGELIDA